MTFLQISVPQTLANDFIPGNGNAANVNITIMVTKYKYHSYIASIAVLLMTLRAGLYVKKGTITIDGHDIKKAPVQAKRVTAFLPDNPDIYEFMKGIDLRAGLYVKNKSLQINQKLFPAHCGVKI